MRVILRWFCLCMLILFFVFSSNDVQSDNQEESTPTKEQFVDVDIDAKNGNKQANSQFVTKRNN